MNPEYDKLCLKIMQGTRPHLENLIRNIINQLNSSSTKPYNLELIARLIEDNDTPLKIVSKKTTKDTTTSTTTLHVSFNNIDKPDWTGS